MMTAALEGLTRADGTRPLLIAVTQLTSTSQQSMEEEIAHPRAAGRRRHRLREKRRRPQGWTAWSARRSRQGRSTRPAAGSFVTVTPGVRFADGEDGRSGARHHPRQGTGASARTISSSAAPSRRLPDPVAAYQPLPAGIRRIIRKEQTMESTEQPHRKGSAVDPAPYSSGRTSPSPGPAASKAPSIATTASP